MASFLSLTAVRSVHPLCLLLWHRRSVVRATEPVSEERVRVWTTTGSWWFSTTRLLPFKRQRRCCEFVWTGQRQRQRRQRTPGQAATEARPLSAAITAWQRRCPRTLSKTTPLYSALFFLKVFQFWFRQSWLTRSQTGAFRPPHLRRLGFADGWSTRCAERQLEKCFFRSRLLAAL